MAVLYPRHFIGERFEHCRPRVIGHCAECGNAKNIRCNALRLLHPTMLKKPEDIEDDIRLTYVAITRATHEAFITYSNMSELVGRLVV